MSSLVRTERYQRRLSRVNRNATKVEIPPHATGMAFDISYKFMAADEQNFIMDHVARLEAEGRVEALRENRNAIHVYTLRRRSAPVGAGGGGLPGRRRGRAPGSAKPAPKPKRPARGGPQPHAARRVRRYSRLSRAPPRGAG